MDVEGLWDYFKPFEGNYSAYLSYVMQKYLLHIFILSWKKEVWVKWKISIEWWFVWQYADLLYGKIDVNLVDQYQMLLLADGQTSIAFSISKS